MQVNQQAGVTIGGNRFTLWESESEPVTDVFKTAAGFWNVSQIFETISHFHLGKSP